MTPKLQQAKKPAKDPASELDAEGRHHPTGRIPTAKTGTPSTNGSPPAKPAQTGLDGKPLPRPNVDHEASVTVRHVFEADHFRLSITEAQLGRIKDLEDVKERRKRLEKKVHPHPEVEQIPAGARPKETDDLVRAALDQPIRTH